MKPGAPLLRLVSDRSRYSHYHTLSDKEEDHRLGRVSTEKKEGSRVQRSGSLAEWNSRVLPTTGE